MTGDRHAPLAALGAELELAGGPLGDALLPASEHRGPAIFGPLAGHGARTRGLAREYALLVESIFEGYLLHYARGRVIDPPDADLRLLAGDYLYAFGLARLALLGDLDAVDELADLISLCARAHASPSDSGEQRAWQLTSGLWMLAALAIGEGAWDEQRAAKRRARDEGAEAAEHVLDVAKTRATQLGRGRDLGPALIGFDQVTGGEFWTT